MDGFQMLEGKCIRFPRTTITSYHKLGDLKQQKFILAQCWRPEAEIKMSAGLAILGIPWSVAA